MIGGWQVDGPIELSALYATHAEDSYIMRLVNPSDEAASGTITLPHEATRTQVDFDDAPIGKPAPAARHHDVRLPPFTVVTYRFDPVET
jgi:alpha-mannosidase